MEKFNLNEVEQLRTETKSANVFGFILYTESHSNIVKVLRDDDYWKGFDKDSEGWIVYSIRPKQGGYHYPESPPGTMSMMMAIWSEPHENSKLLKTFQIQDTQNLPCFVAFALDEFGEIKRVVKRIEDMSIDSARNSIKNSIEIVSKALSFIKPENKNSPYVYREVQKRVEGEIAWENIGKTLNLFKYLKGLAG